MKDVIQLHEILCKFSFLGDPRADEGGEGKSKQAENIYGTKKSKERREEPLGTMSYQTSSKRSPPFWRRPFRTGLVRHCPQGLFSPDEVAKVAELASLLQTYDIL